MKSSRFIDKCFTQFCLILVIYDDSKGVFYNREPYYILYGICFKCTHGGAFINLVISMYIEMRMSFNPLSATRRDSRRQNKVKAKGLGLNIS